MSHTSTAATFDRAGHEGQGLSADYFADWSDGTFAVDPDSENFSAGRRLAEPGLRRDSRRQGLHGNPSRRLRGFVIDFGENQARVGFVQDDQSIIEYLLPEKQLRKAGITAVNQPFEMDEIEQRVDEGYLTGYVFRPMAPAAAVITDSLDADEELAELRDAALRHFGEEADD